MTWTAGGNLQRRIHQTNLDLVWFQYPDAGQKCNLDSSRNEPLVSKLALKKGGEDPVTVDVFSDKEPVNPKESFADDQSSKHIQPDSTVVPAQRV